MDTLLSVSWLETESTAALHRPGHRQLSHSKGGVKSDEWPFRNGPCIRTKKAQQEARAGAAGVMDDLVQELIRWQMFRVGSVDCISGSLFDQMKELRLYGLRVTMSRFHVNMAYVKVKNKRENTSVWFQLHFQLWGSVDSCLSVLMMMWLWPSFITVWEKIDFNVLCLRICVKVKMLKLFTL